MRGASSASGASSANSAFLETLSWSNMERNAATQHMAGLMNEIAIDSASSAWLALPRESPSRPQLHVSLTCTIIS